MKPILFPFTGTINHKWERIDGMIPNMGKNIVNVLAANLTRLTEAGDGMSIVEIARRAQIGKSTIDRIKKGETAVRIDNLEDIARVFRLEAWQLLYPDFDPVRVPVKVEADLTEDEYMLLTLFEDLGEPERKYILAKMKEFLDQQRPRPDSTKKSA